MKFRSLPLPGLILWTLIIGYTILFTTLCWQKLDAHLYNGLDLAIFNNSLFNLLHSGWPTNAIHPASYFADHFSPLLYLLAPIYALWSSPYLLLALQSFLIAVCAWPLYLLTCKRSSADMALAVALAWLVNPWIHWWTLYEFSLIPFFVLGALGLALAYEQKRKYLFITILILTLATREDSLLLLAPWVAILFWRRQDYPTWLALTAGVMIAWFATVITAFSFSGGYKFSSLYHVSDISISRMSLTLAGIISLPYMAFIWSGKKFLPFLLPAMAIVFLHPFGFNRVTSQSHYVAWLIWPLALASTQISRLKLTRLQIPTTIFILAIIIISSSIWSPLRTWKQPSKNIQMAEIDPSTVLAASYTELPNLSSRSVIQLLPYAYWGRGQYNRSDYRLSTNTETIIINWDDMLMARWIWQANYNNNLFDQRLSQNLQTILTNFIPISQSHNTTIFKKADVPHNLVLQTPAADARLGFQKIEPLLYHGLPAIQLRMTLPDTRQSYQLLVKHGTNSRRLELGYGLLQASSSVQNLEQILLLDLEEIDSPLELSVSIDTRPSLRLGLWNQSETIWPNTAPLFATSTLPYTTSLHR